MSCQQGSRCAQKRPCSFKSKFPMEKHENNINGQFEGGNTGARFGSYTEAQNVRGYSGNTEKCEGTNFNDQNFIEYYMKKLDKKICNLQSNPVEPIEFRMNMNLAAENESKLQEPDWNPQPSEPNYAKCSFQQPSCSDAPSCGPCPPLKKKCDTNKSRYDKSCFQSSCTPNTFAYTLKATDWEAEFEKIMNEEIPLLEPPSDSCEPLPSEAIDCPEPKCRVQLPPVNRQIGRKRENTDDLNKLLAKYRQMKKCSEEPPLPPNKRTIPSYSFLYEDEPLAKTLISKKSFDEDC